MPDDSLSTILQYIGAGLAALTVLVGLWSVILSNRDSAKQKIEIARARQEAAEARERAIKLEIEATRQREKTAIAERDLLEMRQLLHGRHLTSFQRRTMIHELQKFAGVGIKVLVNPADPEAVHIADTIVAVVKESGWVVQLEKRQDLASSIRDILVEVSPEADETTRHAGSVLRGSLQSDRIPAELFENSRLGERAGIRVTIGKKTE